MKDGIRAFVDESRSQELLYIAPRQVHGSSTNYEVYDSQSEECVGMLRRKGLTTSSRNTWSFFSTNEKELGILRENSLQTDLLRRIQVGDWLPENYHITIKRIHVADIHQRFNPLRYELEIDFSMDVTHLLDRRLGLAAILLLASIEGR